VPGEGGPDSDDEAGAGAPGSGGAGADVGGEGGRVGERLGRPFLDPRAPRRQESIRSAPAHAEWGVMIDLLEHAAYCDGQREEDADGFFFDLTTPEYDSDCDGDPFANGYLTEDEMEWPEDYTPEAPVPGRVMDQVYFLHTVHKVGLRALCEKYGMSAERVTALIALKRSEPEMIASGRYNTAADDLLLQLYRGRPGTRAARNENWGPDFDAGVAFNVMPDDVVPDEAYPVRRRLGTVLRQGHKLPVLARPTAPIGPERPHKSKFVFRDTSSRTNNKQYHKAQLVSDWNGDRRPASNVEALYRSWETRYWALDQVKGASGFPFKDEEAHAPANFKIPP